MCRAKDPASPFLYLMASHNLHQWSRLGEVEQIPWDKDLMGQALKGSETHLIYQLTVETSAAPPSRSRSLQTCQHTVPVCGQSRSLPSPGPIKFYHTFDLRKCFLSSPAPSFSVHIDPFEVPIEHLLYHDTQGGCTSYPWMPETAPLALTG